MANLFIIGSKQLGKDIFSVENGKVTLNVDKDITEVEIGGYKGADRCDNAANAHF